MRITRQKKSTKPTRSELAAYVGTRLNQLRLERQVTQRDLADATGLSNAYISQVESGQAHPTIDTLWKLSQYFGVPVGWFVDGYVPEEDR